MIPAHSVGDFRLYSYNDPPVPALVPECFTVRGRSLVQRKDGFDECSSLSSIKLRRDFNQLLLIRLDNEESFFHSLIGGTCAVRSNRDHFLIMLFRKKVWICSATIFGA